MALIDTNNPEQMRLLKEALKKAERIEWKKRTGVFPIVVGSTHSVTLRPVGHPPLVSQFTARDYREHPHARSSVLCFHPDCRGRTWPDEAAMRAEHPADITLEKAQQGHAFGHFSSELLNPEDPSSAIVGLMSTAPWEGAA